MTGLIGWWPLHETGGDTVYDLSGNGNHGDLNGPTQGVVGRQGLSAYSFDGESDYVSAPITQADWGESGDKVTFSVWFKADEFDGRLLDGRGGGSASGLLIEPRSDRLAFWPDSGDSAHVYDASFSTDTCYHLVVEWDDPTNTVTVYVDGNEVGDATSDDSVNFDSTRNMNIGRRGNDTDYMSVVVEELRIYRRALSPSEIKELYRQGSRDLHKKSLSDGSDVGAVSRWKLDDGGADGSTAQDVWSGNDGDINGASFTDDSVRNDGGSLWFPGEDDGERVDIDSPDIPDTTNFTFSCWFNYDEITGNWLTILSTQDEDGGTLLAVDDDQMVSHTRCDSSPRPGDIQPGNWYNVIWVVEGSDEKMYLNGELIMDEEGNCGDPLDYSEKSLRIGNNADDRLDRPFNGNLSDLRLYDRALSSWEVFELYRWGSLGKDMRKELVNKKGNGGDT